MSTNLEARAACLIEQDIELCREIGRQLGEWRPHSGMAVTVAQRDLLNFITGYIAKNDGVAPTFNEMCKGIGKSRGRIHEMLTSMEGRGIIRRVPHFARAIEIVRVA